MFVGTEIDCGSSPRARGTGAVVPDVEVVGRFIPARAGNGKTGAGQQPAQAVHPRARGERRSIRQQIATPVGSSPRARGTVYRSQTTAPQRRFIPARAGNGHHSVPSSILISVHPRARGERSHEVRKAFEAYGSSPRARGTGRNAPREHRCQAVHPRARGEREMSIGGIPAATGSSPRARGTGHEARSGHRRRRFIPARAGNGVRVRDPNVTKAVHPRARGERLTTINDSSIRARFIPARAGNGQKSCVVTTDTAVHPRARGERGGMRGPACVCGGSSPRARGTGRRH